MRERHLHIGIIGRQQRRSFKFGSRLLIALELGEQKTKLLMRGFLRWRDFDLFLVRRYCVIETPELLQFCPEFRVGMSVVRICVKLFLKSLRCFLVLVEPGIGLTEVVPPFFCGGILVVAATWRLWRSPDA